MNHGSGVYDRTGMDRRTSQWKDPALPKLGESGEIQIGLVTDDAGAT